MSINEQTRFYERGQGPTGPRNFHGPFIVPPLPYESMKFRNVNE